MGQHSEIERGTHVLSAKAGKALRSDRADNKPESGPARSGKGEGGRKDLKRDDYEKILRKLHVKLVDLQEWVRHEAAKVCIVFEGRDGAGKGGTIKALTARVSPRIFRVVALSGGNLNT